MQTLRSRKFYLTGVDAIHSKSCTVHNTVTHTPIVRHYDYCLYMRMNMLLLYFLFSQIFCDVAYLTLCYNCYKQFLRFIIAENISNQINFIIFKNLFKNQELWITENYK